MAKVNFNYNFVNIITFSNSKMEEEANLLRSNSVKQLFLVLVKKVEEIITTDEEITISVDGEIVCENDNVKLINKNIKIDAQKESKRLIHEIFEGFQP